jgi:hypothetical protein
MKCARLAGFTFLIYIVTSIISMVLHGQATGGAEGTAAKLESIAQNAYLVRVDILLTLLCAAYAVILAVLLYSLTRDENPHLAMIALCCRFSEGFILVLAPVISLGQLSVASMSVSASAADVSASNALGVLALKIGDWSGIMGAICFSAGSLIYSYLFLRSRRIPVPLAWFGVVASILLVVILPLQLTGFYEGPALNYIWFPMLGFEVTLALWLLIKGVAMRPAEA